MRIKVGEKFVKIWMRSTAGLLLAVLCVLLTPMARAAGTQVTLSWPRSVPQPGGEFEAVVSLADNPGFCSAQLSLRYDPAVVECTSVEAGAVLRGVLSAANPTANGNTATLAAVSVEAVTGSGVLLRCRFRVLAAGDPQLALTEARLIDSDGGAIFYTLYTERTGSGVSAPVTPSPTPAEPEPMIPEPEEPEQSIFADVPNGHPYAAVIRRAAEEKLVFGCGGGMFYPDVQATRAQFVTMLWRMKGEPEPAGAPKFTDVRDGTWYSKAVAWATEQGYVKGVTSSRFEPNALVTREQAVAVLFRAAGGVSGSELLLAGIYDSTISDVPDVGLWAKNAVYWGLYHSVITLDSAQRTAPKAPLTRAEITELFLRFRDNIEKGA